MSARWISIAGVLAGISVANPAAAETKYYGDCTAADATARLKIEACTFSLQVDQLDNRQKMEALSARAAAYMRFNFFENAKADLNQAIRLEPDNGHLRRQLADLNSFGGGTRNEAVESYENVAKNEPGNSAALLDLAVAYQAAGNLDGSKSAVDRVLAIEPDNKKAIFLRGTIFDQQHEFGKALEDYNRVLTLDPNFGPAQQARANTYFLLGQYPAAVADYDVLFQRIPETVPYRRYRAAAKYAMGDAAAAIPDLEHDLQYDKYANHLRIWRFLCQFRLGETSTAELQALAKDSHDNWFAAAAQYLSGEIDQAGFLTAIWAKSPDLMQVRYSETHFVIAERAFLKGETTVARTEYEAVLKNGLRFAEMRPEVGFPVAPLVLDTTMEWSIAAARLKELSK